MLSFVDVIQMPLSELHLSRWGGVFESPVVKTYAQVIEAYLRAEKEKLLEFVDLVPDELKDLVLLRYQIVAGKLTLDLIQKIERSKEELGVWEGEAAFILGLACWDLNDNTRALRNFQSAYVKLSGIGAHNKAVKALMNIVVSESRIDPTQRCITSYEFVKDKALEVSDFVVAGICYHNIAKEYFRLGGFDLSLKLSNLALDLLQNDKGTIHYFEVLLHRCHTLIELQRHNEALIDFQLAKASKNERIQEALKAIEVLLGEKKDIRLSHLEPAWRAKLHDLRAEVKTDSLTKYEAELIKSLSSGPKTKLELATLLYGNKIDDLSAENRISVLLSRFRKKYPDLIAVEDGHYLLTDNEMVESLKA